MSEGTKSELLNIKPLSRFVERFDFSPPPELLEIVEESNKVPPLSQSISTRPSKLVIKDPILNMYNSNDQMLSPTSPSYVPSKSFSSTRATNRTSLPPLSKVTRPPNPGPSKSANRVETQEQEYHNQPKIPRKHLNRADIIIRRYDSWFKFLTVLISWINELVRTTTQSERSLNTLLRETRFSNTKGSDIKSANEIHALIHGFTADLASQEQQFIQDLKKQVPILEKFKKECATSNKALKSRSDLAQDEFLKRAELTASFMAQLTKACKEARRTVEKNAQLTTDPWLVNLYVLRQLKREVDEDNRLRKLMVPIQQKIKEFEQKMLKAVDDALRVCFDLPNSFMPKEKVTQIQLALTKAIDCNWGSFVASNKKVFVDEEDPEKNYLQINYPYKNDPFVMTLHKGQLERRMGVLSKFTSKFFVLTESGFLHQFKLSDKVSPEHTIYIPNATVVPCIDITNLNQKKLDVQKKTSRDYYTFEIQRTGSVLQRDKSYSFRLSSLEEMIVWCKFLQNVATRPYDTLLHEKTADITNSTRNSMFLDNTYQVQESTPPPSPNPKQGSSDKILLDDEKQQSDSSFSDRGIDTVEFANDNFNTRYDIYAPKLNI